MSIGKSSEKKHKMKRSSHLWHPQKLNSGLLRLSAQKLLQNSRRHTRSLIKL